MTRDQKNQYFDHAQFLVYTLLPDLQEMGMTQTAADLRKAATIIETLLSHVTHLEANQSMKG